MIKSNLYVRPVNIFPNFWHWISVRLFRQQEQSINVE